ncbi:MAG: hypothetical protein ACLFUO_06590 [Candidatus Woesearchaeota archaeon]
MIVENAHKTDKEIRLDTKTIGGLFFDQIKSLTRKSCTTAMCFAMDARRCC